MKKINVAFFHLDLYKGNPRGPEIFFPYLFNELCRQKNFSFDLFFLTSPLSLKYLSKVIDPKYAGRIIYLKEVSNRFKDILQNLDFAVTIIRRRIKLIHISTYDSHINHYSRFKFIHKLPGFIRPKIVLNIHHCGFPYEYLDTTSFNHKSLHGKYSPLFSNIEIDGIFTWYEAFREFAKQHIPFKKSDIDIYAVQSYFCETAYKPAQSKERSIVFAAAMEKWKHPEMFLNAIAIVKKSEPDLLREWKVLMCGSGSLDESLKQNIKDLDLENTVDFLGYVDLKKVYPVSTCFVSTQDHENFTSLAMHEAISAGNVIISRNVGQTYLYVKDGVNGFLAKTDDAQGIADCIIQLLKQPEKIPAMIENGLSLLEKVHNVKNFTAELELFWNRILKAKS